MRLCDWYERVQNTVVAKVKDRFNSGSGPDVVNGLIRCMLNF